VKNRVDIRMSNSAADVLGRISAGTERETLPFISASRFPRQSENRFVSKVSGNKFRIWKAPSAKGGRNLGTLYLHGVVCDLDGESNLKASFAFHPFNIVMALIPFVMAALIWTWGSRTAWEMIFIAVLFAAELMLVLSVRSARPREEHETVEFILGLFPNAHQTSSQIFGR
jgi:hypothetical protein